MQASSHKRLLKAQAAPNLGTTCCTSRRRSIRARHTCGVVQPDCYAAHSTKVGPIHLAPFAKDWGPLRARRWGVPMHTRIHASTSKPMHACADAYTHARTRTHTHTLMSASSQLLDQTGPPVLTRGAQSCGSMRGSRPRRAPPSASALRQGVGGEAGLCREMGREWCGNSAGGYR